MSPCLPDTLDSTLLLRMKNTGLYFFLILTETEQKLDQDDVQQLEFIEKEVEAGFYWKHWVKNASLCL